MKLKQIKKISAFLLLSTFGLYNVNGQEASTVQFTLNPNPVKNTAEITYQLENSSQIKLEIYDSNGKLVKVLDEGIKEAGLNTYNFNKKEYANGWYFFKLETDDGTITRKTILIE